MKRAWVLASLCVVASPAARCTAQTRQQAQSLPLAQLAQLVLGAVGSTIIDVDRPQWVAHCGGPLCPPVSPEEERRRGPAPLTEQGLTFYQRAEPTPGGLQWTGLCSSTAIHVSYEDSGRPGSVETSKRFGIAESTKRVDPAGGPELRQNFPAEQRACATITSVRDFYYADDETAAYRAALAARLFARAVGSGKPLPFTFACQIIGAPCGGPQQVAKQFRVENIRSVRPVDCDPSAAAGKAKPSCYEISLRQLGEAVDVELIEKNETVHLLRVGYRMGGAVI